MSFGRERLTRNNSAPEPSRKCDGRRRTPSRKSRMNPATTPTQPRIAKLTTRERRRPLLQKMRDPFTKILSAEASLHLLRRQIERLAEILQQPRINLPLHDAQRSRRNVRRQIAREFL